jgi:DNA modification methylase
MKITQADIKSIIPNPNNPRVIKDDKYHKLVKSIKEFPKMLEIRPIVVNSDWVVLGGNMRLKACMEAGLKIIPVIHAEDLTEDQQREFIIKDNVGFGEWDWQSLQSDWDLEKLDEWGMDIPDFAEKELEAEEDDYKMPDVVQTDIVLGDLFEIGEHRLLCGDSTDSDAVAKLMNGQKADISFTSPPYNAAKNSHLNGRVKGFDEKYQQKNDSKSDEDYLKFLYDFTINSLNFSIYSFVNIQLLAQNKFVLIDFQYQMKKFIKDILIWNKSQCPPNIVKGAFNTKWEYVFCFSNINETRGFPCSWQGKYSNVIETESSSGNEYAEIHKATFPIAFPSWIIEKMDFAKSILDLFLGTGTTMVASHQLKRKCYGMELDPKYCQVIVDRMLKLDPTLEIKRNGKPYKTAQLQHDGSERY